MLSAHVTSDRVSAGRCATFVFNDSLSARRWRTFATTVRVLSRMRSASVVRAVLASDNRQGLVGEALPVQRTDHRGGAGDTLADVYTDVNRQFLGLFRPGERITTEAARQVIDVDGLFDDAGRGSPQVS